MGEEITAAAKEINLWRGISSLFPLLGAFLADSYFGRFNTVLISTVIYLMGLILLTISVAVIPLHHRRTVFFTALYILSVGEGGHKPCVQTFAADQFDEELPEEKETKSSFFNWWYLGLVIAATTSIVVVVYVQNYVGWAIGFGLPIGVVAMALALFLIGKRTYRREAPVGSPFTKVAQVFIAAIKKWRLSETRDGLDLCYDDENNIGTQVLARTNQFRLLDKATIIDEIDLSNKTRNHWRLCSINQVEQVKLLLRLFPIWLSCLFFTLVNAQQTTYFTKQVATLNTSIGPHFHIPPASFQVVTGIAILTAVPCYDRLLVPAARSLSGHPSGITMLQRIGVGIFFSFLAMVVSALVESKRIHIAMTNGLIDNPKAIIPMSAWWMVPQYVLCGFSDVFTIVGLQELFYDQVPEEMRSMGAAAHISALGVGSLVSSVVISAVQGLSKGVGGGGEGWLGGGNNLNRDHLDYFYWVLAGLSGLGLCVYVWFARGFVYKKVDSCEDDGLNLHVKV
ncbi:hypothetical protein LguiB_011289 [Lonicera macranthoides]